ncbi:MAG TPA: DUF3084 domain-containing protein [Chroococcidiopsis sp.]
MTTGLILIAAILVLGGVIATMGDRIGMRVGKARLSLFALRPRQTATLITIMTGVLISASTFGILFAIDDQLRTGVFELEEIQQDLSSAREELGRSQSARKKARTDLRQARTEQRTAQERLQLINRSLRQAIAQQRETEAQLKTAQTNLQQAEAQRVQAQARAAQEQSRATQAEAQRSQAQQQAAQLRTEIEQLQRDRRQQLTQLQDLEAQRQDLLQAIETLEREFQGLRQGNVALLRNQPLASDVVRIVAPSAATQAVDQLLREANRAAAQRILPGTESVVAQVIRVATAQVEEIVSQIRDGSDYVIRVFSSGNYVVGEPCVLAGESCIQVYLSAILNQVVFTQGEVITAMTVNPAELDDQRLAERVSLLVAAPQLRARQAGVLNDDIQIAGGRAETLLSFFDRLNQLQQPVEIQAVSTTTAYTAGPVRIELFAVQNGQVLFGTNAD